MRYILEVSSRGLAGREAEYDRWYEDTHVGEVLGVPGFRACERFERLTPDMSGVTELVSLYEVETNDPAALLQSLYAASANMKLTDSIDVTTVRFEFLRPTGSGRRVSPA